MATVLRSARGRRSPFFVIAALVLLTLVFIGFSATLYLRGVVTAPRPPFPLTAYVVVHGVVMTSWYLLFLVQASLVAANRVDLHRRLGVVGVVLAASVVVTGAYVTLHMPQYHISLGMPVSVHREQLPFFGIVIGNLIRLAFFAGIVTAAILLRRRPQWHGRLMFWSFVFTVQPAFGGQGTRPLGPLVAPLIAPLRGWLPLPLAVVVFALAFIALCAHDLMKLRRIHPASVTGASVAFAFVVLVIWIRSTEVAREFYLGLAG